MVDHNQKKILFYSEGWGHGGIETFIMNAVRVLNKDQFKFDIFCTHDWSNVHDKEIGALGGNRQAVFRGRKPNLVKRFFYSTWEFKKKVYEGDYDIVHVNGMNGMAFIYTRIAQKAGVPVRIMHSHNTDFGRGARFIKRIMHNFGKKRWGDSPSLRLACSTEAGSYLFDAASFHVLNNAIDTDLFRFDKKERERFRTMLGLSDSTTLVGSMGRITEQKNPFFILQVFNSLLSINPSAKLLMVGDGDLKEEIKRKIDSEGIQESVWLMSSTDNPAAVYSALDVFLLPSRFEGLALASIEAQCSGLAIFASDNVSPSVEITDLVHWKSLEDDPDNWAIGINKVLEQSSVDERALYAREITQKGYSLQHLSSMLGRYYNDLENGF